MTIIKYFLYLIIPFLSTNAFSQAQNKSLLKLSDDFIQKIEFETDYGSVYLANVKTPQLDTGYKFMLDNGCRETFISESLANELNFKPTGKRKILDIFENQEKLPIGRLDYIIGGVLFKSIKTVVVPDESFEDECDVKGIIGLNLIEKCIWSISLKNGVFISSGTSSFPLEEYVKQKFLSKSAIKWNFLGETPIMAMFDLGMNSFLVVNPKYLDSPVKVKEARKAFTNQAYEGALLSYKNDVTHEKKAELTYAMVEGFSLLGDSTIKNAIIEIDSSDYSFLYIGSKILYCYDIILNVNKKEFYSRNVKTQFNQIKNYGFGYDVLDSFLLVSYLIENAPAAKCGILLNDTITEINNKPITEIINNVRKCELTDAVFDELYKNDEALIKVSRFEKPILIKKEYLFEN